MSHYVLILVMWIRCRGFTMSRDELKVLICTNQELSYILQAQECN